MAEQLSPPGILVEMCTMEEKKQAPGSRGSPLARQGRVSVFWLTRRQFLAARALRYLERRPEPDGLIAPEAELRTQPKNSLYSRSCWFAAGVVDDGIAEEARWAFVSLSGWEACKSALSEPVLPLLPLCPLLSPSSAAQGLSLFSGSFLHIIKSVSFFAFLPPFYFSSCSHLFAREMQSVKAVPFLWLNLKQMCF